MVGRTVTWQVPALPLPSVAVAVMIAEPTLRAVTTPMLLTVATLVLLDFHVNVLLVALAGSTVVLSLMVSPACISTEAGVTVTEVTRTGFTVTRQVARLPLPSLALAVMVAVPGATAVTMPLLFT